MGVTPRDIVDKVFTKSFRGYDEEEVDLFLDEIIKELEAKNNETRAQYGRINELMARLSAAQQVVMPGNLIETQRSAEEFLTSANMKARTIVQQAEQSAANIKANAELIAKQRVEEAETSAKDILMRAEHEARTMIQNAQREAIGLTGTPAGASARISELRQAANAQSCAPRQTLSDTEALQDAQVNGISAIEDQIGQLVQTFPELKSRGQTEAAPEGKDGAPEQADAGLLPPFDPSWMIRPDEEDQNAGQGDAEHDDGAHFVPSAAPFSSEIDDPLPADWGDDDDDGLYEALARIGVDI